MLIDLIVLKSRAFTLKSVNLVSLSIGSSVPFSIFDESLLSEKKPVRFEGFF